MTKSSIKITSIYIIKQQKYIYFRADHVCKKKQHVEWQDGCASVDYVLMMVLTVLLSFYAKLDIIVVLYPLRSVVHMLTLNIWLEIENRHSPAGVRLYGSIVESKILFLKRVTSSFHLLLFLNWAFSRLYPVPRCLSLTTSYHYCEISCTHLPPLHRERRKEREKTYHHLSSEELRDGSFNTSAFHFVLHIVQELKHICIQSVNYSAHTHVHTLYPLRQYERTHHSAQLLYIMLHEAI